MDSIGRNRFENEENVRIVSSEISGNKKTNEHTSVDGNEISFSNLTKEKRTALSLVLSDNNDYQREIKKLKVHLKDKDKQVQVAHRNMQLMQSKIDEYEFQIMRYRFKEKEALRKLSAKETAEKRNKVALKQINDQLERVSKKEENRIRRLNLERKELLDELEKIEENFELEYLELEEEKNNLIQSMEEKHDGIISTLKKDFEIKIAYLEQTVNCTKEEYEKQIEILNHTFLKEKMQLNSKIENILITNENNQLCHQNLLEQNQYLLEQISEYEKKIHGLEVNIQKQKEENLINESNLQLMKSTSIENQHIIESLQQQLQDTILSIQHLKGIHIYIF